MLNIQLISAADAAVDQTSAGYQKGDSTGYYVQFNFSSNTINGTVSLEGSPDNVNYNLVDGSQVSATSGGTISINVSGANYRYVRAKWVAGSGSGTVTCLLNLVQPQAN